MILCIVLLVILVWSVSYVISMKQEHYHLEMIQFMTPEEIENSNGAKLFSKLSLEQFYSLSDEQQNAILRLIGLRKPSLA